MNIWKRIKKEIKQFIESQKKPEKRYEFPYPYLVNYEEDGLEFEVNNHIERYRLKDFGGEEGFVRNLVSYLKPGDVFYDIGASVGLVSIFAAKKVKRVLWSGRVYSFEPDPENSTRLKRNYELNKLRNYQIVNVAVSNQKGKLKLFTGGSDANSPSLQQVNGIETSLEVDTISIDEELRNNRFTYPDVVKIDIEGAEMLALQGMRDLLRSNKKPRLVFIEIHPAFLPAFNTSESEIHSLFNDCEYNLIEKEIRDEQVLCIYSSEIAPN